MKQLFYTLILVFPLLGMMPSKEKAQRKVVENYVATLLKTEDENIQEVFSLLKITREYSEEEIEDGIKFLLAVKHYLQGDDYKILNYEQANEEFKKRDADAMFSDKGDVYYIYDTTKDVVFFEASIVVNDDLEIISIAVGMCDHPQRLCFIYL